MTRKIFFILAFLFFAAGSGLMANLGGVAKSQRAVLIAAEPYFRPPVSTPSGALVVRTDKYGKGYFGASRNGGRKHAGVDLVCPIRDPIYAAKSGRVTRAAEERGYGKHVYILHPDGSVTRYAHLDRLDVFQGQWVRASQVIGACGRTGNASNLKMTPHLHFEIRYDNKPNDPVVGRFDPRLRISHQIR